jgi:ABC-type Fe3+/spermidine/putrescine transport system ATPase subunit
MTQIELVELHKSYPRQAHPAVAGVSLNVEPHTLLALLGPSGSGKSSILKLIAGIEAPDTGDIRLDGQSVRNMPAHRRGAVLMFQKAYLFPFLSVAENIAFGLRVQGARRATIRAEVTRMLDLVELPGIAAKRPAQLSGGEQQRVALARALVVRPRVLLLDEPFSSLDAAVRQTLQEAVRRIQRELGITTILVTHDRSEAMALADRVALLDHGTMLAADTPRQLFLRPPTRRAARLMGVATFLRGEIAGASFQTSLGTFAICAEHRRDGPATYAIRPEHMRLCGEPGRNTLPARILAHTFRGEQSEYLLQAGDQTLRVRTFAPTTLPEGSQIYVQLPPEQLFPVCDDASDTDPKGACEYA